MYTAVPPLLHSVAANSKFYPGIITELKGGFSNLNLVSFTPKISNTKLCSEIRVESSSMWKGSEKIFKWNKDRQFYELFIKDESSQGSQYLLETVADEGSSIVSLSWLIRSWLGEVWFFVRTVNLILDPWFVLKSSSLEIVPKRKISSEHFMQYNVVGLFCKNL